MIIQHNMSAMANLLQSKQTQKSQRKVIERLSSGYRINRAADDAAGLAISEKMNARIRALSRCQDNIMEGIDLTQTADGALQEVNDMLNRVHELCVQAANDTNTVADREMIADEISQIYEEMDRIFEDTEFNTIPVFRWKGSSAYAAEPTYKYIESIQETPPSGGLAEWGGVEFPTREFDKAVEGQGATVTLTFDSSIDFNDVSTLNGLCFSIKNKNGGVSKFQFGTEAAAGYTTINTTGCSSIQAAFNKVSYTGIKNITVDEQNRTVTFEFVTQKNNYTYTYKADTDGDGIKDTLETAYDTVTNGTYFNGYTVYSEGTRLLPVDSTSNTITYGKTITQTLSIMGSSSNSTPLSQTQKDNLVRNTLVLSANTPSAASKSINFTSDINLNNISTVGELRQAIANAINSKTQSNAATLNADGTINVTFTGCTGYSNAYIYEQNVRATSTPPTTTSPTTTFTVQSTAITNVSVSTKAGTAESKQTHTITVPKVTGDGPFSLNIKGYTYTFYKPSLYSQYDGNISISNGVAVSDSQTFESVIASKIASVYGGSNYNYTITEENGNKVVKLTSKQVNYNGTISINTPSSTPSLSVIKPGTTIPGQLIDPGTSRVLGIGTSYYTQEYSLPLNIKESVGDNFDTTKLYGRGFYLNGKYYQFSAEDSETNLYNSNTVAIGVNGINSYADLCTKIKDKIKSTNSSTFSNLKVEEDTAKPGTIKLTLSRSTGSSSNSFSFFDGAPGGGLFTSSATSAGGTTHKNPQTEIDFSQYTAENISDLYGTGFRITCATCPGEFINIMFCYDKNSFSYPDSFEYTDENGNTNTIRNYMVELKDITDGSQIAENIVSQLENHLDHFTEVKVSDKNPAILIAQDKRPHDQKDRAEVITGVYTNFTYNIIKEEIIDNSEFIDGGKTGLTAYYGYINIYASDTAEKPYIPIHLPYLTLENLGLEDPTDNFETIEDVYNIMTRSKNAAKAITMARSKIGADENHLEHAYASSANAEIQMTDAYSRVKDADMAKMAMVQAKISILSQAQQSMLAQIIRQPDAIVNLLQQM